MATRVIQKENIMKKMKINTPKATNIPALRAVVQDLINYIEELETRLNKLDSQGKKIN